MTEFPHPLRLAAGSHEPGSGKGCAMNLVSYINGDTKITDYPACSARPLARMVQIVNDRFAGPDGFLSPEDSVRVLDLGWRTVGTADADEFVLWQWLHDLLVDESHGVVRYARADGVDAIRRVAGLLAGKARGEFVSQEEFAANAAANAAAYAANAANAEVYAAAYAANAANAAAYAAAYATYAANAAAKAANAADAEVYDLADWAIKRWRELQDLDAPTLIAPQDVAFAIEQIGASK